MIRFSVKHPIVVSVFAIIMIVLGLFAVYKLPIDYMPELDLPVVAVMVPYPGADAQTIEEDIVKPMEGFLGAARNLKKLKAISYDDIAVIIMEFHSFVDKKEAADATREEIEKFKSLYRLPDGAYEPALFQIDPSDMPILFITMTTDKLAPRQLLSLIDKQIKPEFETLDGVGSVIVFGSEKREIKIVPRINDFIAKKINLFDFDNKVSQYLKDYSADNQNKSFANVRIKVKEKPEYVSYIKNIPIVGTGTVLLKDVADVYDSIAKRTGITLIDDIPAVQMAIKKQKGANTVAVTDKVKKKLNEILKKYPYIKASYGFEIAAFVRDSLENLKKNASISAAVVSIVIFLFLKRFFAVFASLLSIPISFIFTFFALYLKGFTLNTISLGGLAIAIGMLVDNTVVVTENIARIFKEEKLPRHEAAIKGASEVVVPVFASTLTTVIIFLPIVFAKGLASRLFGQLALTITFSLLISIFVSFTVTVSVVGKFVKEIKEGAIFRFFRDWYVKLVKFVSRYAFIFLLIFVFLVVFTAKHIGKINKEFLGTTDEDSFGITVKLYRGISWQVTKKVVDDFVKELREKIPEIQNIMESVGDTATSKVQSAVMGGDSGLEVGSIWILLKSKRNRTTNDIVNQIAAISKHYPFLSFSIKRIGSALVGAGDGVSIKLMSPDRDTLEKVATKLKDDMLKTFPDIIKSVSSTLDDVKMEEDLKLKKDIASKLNILPSAVHVCAYSSTKGFKLGKLLLNDETIDVRQKFDTDIDDVIIPLGKDFIWLKDLVKKEYKLKPLNLYREKKLNLVELIAQIDPKVPIGKVKDLIENKLLKNLPNSISYYFGGKIEKMKETFADLKIMMILAIILVYLVMVAQFESYILPFLIMLLLPIDVIFAVFGLSVMHLNMGVSAFLGIIILIGIAVNNGIVFIDVFKNFVQAGFGYYYAVVEAARRRFRPILITSITTIVGMLPLAFAVGKGSETQQPMGTVILFGMLAATFVSLVVLPSLLVLYSKIFRLKKEGIENEKEIDN